MYAAGRGWCPQAQAASRELISLPLHLDLTRDDIDRVADLIRRGLH